MLARARRGQWYSDERVFVVQQALHKRDAVGPQCQWEVTSDSFSDLGPVRVVARGEQVLWVELQMRWLSTQRPSNSHFLPWDCRLGLVVPHADPGNHMGLLNIPPTDVTCITTAIDAWERRWDTLSLELRALLEGTYVISRSGQPFQPFFMRNHSSLDEEALEALWPVIAKMLWRGVFEYIERHQPLPVRGSGKIGTAVQAAHYRP